jgi:hypothetical protein
MRRILLDEGVPVGVRSLIVGYSVEAVPEIGWAGLTNGDLIRAAEEAGFTIIITCDQNIRYQQNLTGRRIALVVLTSNHWDTTRTNSDGIMPTIEAAAEGGFAVLAMPKPPRRRRPYPTPKPTEDIGLA